MVEYNFIQFTVSPKVGYEPEPYISLCASGQLRMSNSLQETGLFKVGDKITVFYDTNLKLIKIIQSEEDKIGRELRRSFTISVYELEKIMPKGRYFQTEDKNIFKLEPPPIIRG